jgi:hypothetical protein
MDDILESFGRKFIYPRLRQAALLEAQQDEQREAGEVEVIATLPVGLLVVDETVFRKRNYW